MKIIFLDIDGVLNSQIWSKSDERIKLYKESDSEISSFDPKSIGILNEIVESTGAKVVISSSWRIGKTIPELINLFENVGFEGEIIGKTPNLSFTGLVDYYYSVPRGCEIKAWLETNKSLLNEKVSKVKYVILDDDSDMLYWQRNKFVWVDSYCGLTINTAFKAKQILNS